MRMYQLRLRPRSFDRQLGHSPEVLDLPQSQTHRFSESYGQFVLNWIELPECVKPSEKRQPTAVRQATETPPWKKRRSANRILRGKSS